MTEDIFDDYPAKTIDDLYDSVFTEREMEQSVIMYFQEVAPDGTTKIVEIDLDTGERWVLPLFS